MIQQNKPVSQEEIEKEIDNRIAEAKAMRESHLEFLAMVRRESQEKQKCNRLNWKYIVMQMQASGRR